MSGPNAEALPELPNSAVKSVPAKAGRLAFIDWTRGVAALIMLQGHVFHSFVRNDLRESGPYTISQFFGGLAPAIFLFLTGVTLGFLMDGQERKGKPPMARFTASLRRAAYLLTIAMLFRVQLWLFSLPYGAISQVLKVDILNCMFLGILLLSPLALVTTGERIRHALVIGLLITAASPLVSPSNTAGLPEIVRMYIVPDFQYFSFFPWAAFIAFGLSVGSILKRIPENEMHRVMQWAAIIGFGLILSAQYFSNLPYSLYPASDFWLNSPGLIFIKFGVILVILALAFLWNYHHDEGWSWVRQMGVTSLLVYWVHIELVYGRWLSFWKESLDNVQCAAVAGLLWIAMLGLSLASTHWHWKGVRSWFSFVATGPERVSGD